MIPYNAVSGSVIWGRGSMSDPLHEGNSQWNTVLKYRFENTSLRQATGTVSRKDRFQNSFDAAQAFNLKWKGQSGWSMEVTIILEIEGPALSLADTWSWTRLQTFVSPSENLSTLTPRTLRPRYDAHEKCEFTGTNIFGPLSLFRKNKNRLLTSQCCLCVFL